MLVDFSALDSSKGEVACTIVSRRHFPQARVIARSLREHHPDIPFVVLLADSYDSVLLEDNEPFQVVEAGTWLTKEFARLAFIVSEMELSYALTPFWIRALLGKGFDRVIFIKQESLVTGTLEPEFNLLKEHSIFLTPHLLEPLAGEEAVGRELAILLAGTYNGGILGVQSSNQGYAFLDWWGDRVAWRCVHSVAEGLHYEQRWLMLAPAYFEETHIHRDETINVGHWNLDQRDLHLDDEMLNIGEERCRLFRFSGFDPDKPEYLTRYYERKTAPAVRPLFHRIAELLKENGYDECKALPYAFESFDNGIPIPEIARQLYRTEGHRSNFGNPRETEKAGSFHSWLKGGIDESPVQTRITRIWKAVYEIRPDVQAHFPDIQGENRVDFLAWTRNSGLAEHQIDESFLGHNPLAS